MENRCINTVIPALCLLILGCKEAQRDMPTDPANTPVVVPQEAVYDDQKGMVSIRWEYLGVDPVARFRLIRVEREALNPLNWVTATLTRDISQRSDVWIMEDAEDPLVNAGEEYSYFLRAENIHGTIIEAPGGVVQIPGAYIGDVALDEAQGTATVAWETKAGTPHRFELFRQVGDGSVEKIYESADPGTARFVDAVPQGNQVYRYFLRNTLDHGVVLDSRTMVLQPYMRNRDFDVAATGAHVALAPGQAFGQPMLMMAATDREISVQKLNFFGQTFAPVILDAPNRALLKPASLSFAVTPIGRPRTPRLLLAGVLPDENRVQLSAFTLLGQTSLLAPWDASVWPVDDPDTRTAMAVAPDGTILVVAGAVLRYFIPDGDGIGYGGEIDLGLRSAVRQIAAFDAGIWVVLEDGSAWRSGPVWDAAGAPVVPAWSPVGDVADGVGLGAKNDLVFVVEGSTRRVQCFDFDGRAGFWWAGIEDLDLRDAALSVALNGDVYMRDAAGRLAVFQHVFSSLALLPGQEEGI